MGQVGSREPSRFARLILTVAGVALTVAALLADAVVSGGTGGIGLVQWLGALAGATLVGLGIKGRSSLVPDLIGWLGKTTDLPALDLTRTLVWCVLFGIGGGLAETALQFVQLSLGHRFDYFKPSSVWMAPVSYTALLTILGLSLWLAGRFVWAFLGSERVLLFAIVLLVSLGLLLNYHPELAEVPILLLAAGLATQLTRVIKRRSKHLMAFIGRRSWASVVVLLLVEAAILLGPQLRERIALGRLGEAPAGARNVILIILDTVRAQSFGLYGYARNTTHHLEQRATGGAIFDHAYATAPWTLPTHAGIFTGFYPHDLSVDHLVPLDDTQPTLAEVFARNGYRTAGFVGNSRYAGPHTGLARGFSRYETDMLSIRRIFGASGLGRLMLFPQLRGQPYDRIVDRKEAPIVTRQFLSWVSKVREQPFFAFLNYFDAHHPYQPPPPYDSMFSDDVGPDVPMDVATLSPRYVERQLRAYDGAIAYLDEELEGLFEELQRRGVLENTVVIVTSDHGEEFAEHDDIMRHANSLYRPTLQVPLVIFGPDIPAGVRIDKPVSVRDLAATAVELAGISQHPFPSASLSRFWGEPQTDSGHGEGVTENPPADLVLAELTTAMGGRLPSWQHMLAAISAEYHYILREDGQEWLFHVEGDPWEQQDLAQQPEHRTLLLEYRARVQPDAGKYFKRPHPEGTRVDRPDR